VDGVMRIAAVLRLATRRAVTRGAGATGAMVRAANIVVAVPRVSVRAAAVSQIGSLVRSYLL